MTGDVGENRERARGNDHAANRQPVQAVGKIHRIGRTHDDRHDKNQERQVGQRPEVRPRKQRMNHQIRMKILEEWDAELRRISAAGCERQQSEARSAKLARVCKENLRLPVRPRFRRFTTLL